MHLPQRIEEARRATLAASVLVAVMLALALAVVPGCSRPSASTPAPAPAPKTPPQAAVLGPYPMNVRVWLGRIALTLTSVQVLAPEDSAGPFILKKGTYERAPSGTRFVDVTVRVDDSTRTQLQAPELIVAPVVIADGKTIRAGARATSFTGNVYSTYHETMEFAVPDHASSVVLRLPLTAESTEVASFRLW